MTLEQTKSSELTLDPQELQKETTLSKEDVFDTQSIEPDHTVQIDVTDAKIITQDQDQDQGQNSLDSIQKEVALSPVLDQNSTSTEIKGDINEEAAEETEEESSPTPLPGLLAKSLGGASIQEKERTLGFIRNLDMHETDNTIEEIKSAGFDILHRRTHIQFTLEQAQILYRSQSNQKIKEELVLGLISGPVEGIILEKVDAINAWRIFAGLKNPADTESDHRVREKGVIYASTCVANISEDIELVLSASDVKAKDQAEEYKENKEEPAVGNESKDIKKEEINTSTSSTKPESPKHMESDPKVITVSKAEKPKNPGETSIRKPSKLGTLQKTPIKPKKQNEIKPPVNKEQKPTSASRLKQPGFQVTISTGLLAINKNKSPTSANTTSPASATSIRGATGIARPTSRRPSVIQTEEMSKKPISATTTAAKTPPMPRVVMMAHKNASERTKEAIESKKGSPKASRGALARLTAPTAASTRKQAPSTSPSTSPLTPKTPSERLVRTTRKTGVASAVASDVSVVVPPISADKSIKSPKLLQSAKKTNASGSVSRIGKPSTAPETVEKQQKTPAIARKFAIHLPRVQPAKPKVTTDIARAAVPEKSSDLKSVRSHLESGKEIARRAKPLGYLKKPSTKVLPSPTTKIAKKVEVVTVEVSTTKNDSTSVVTLNPTESQEIQKSSEASSVSSSRPVTPEGIQNMPNRPKVESACLTETQTA